MKKLLALLAAALLATGAHACDVCGIFLGIQPNDRASSIGLLYRYRHLQGTLPTALLPKTGPKHGDHGTATATGQALHNEQFLVAELRADLWLTGRFNVMAALPVVNNYQAVDGIVRADVYGLGDALLLPRYLVANTRAGTGEERTVHRLLLGAGAKLPLGRTDLRYNDAPVAHDLQPGTGTWDALLSAEYSLRRGRNGASLQAITRLNSADRDGHRMGHGVNATLECFRRYDAGAGKLLPSLGVYLELAGKDAHRGLAVDGTGGSTLFTHAGARVWWRSWSIMGAFQYAIARQLGELMVPNRERAIIGLSYFLNQRNSTP